MVQIFNKRAQGQKINLPEAIHQVRGKIRVRCLSNVTHGLSTEPQLLPARLPPIVYISSVEYVHFLHSPFSHLFHIFGFLTDDNFISVVSFIYYLQPQRNNESVIRQNNNINFYTSQQMQDQKESYKSFS